MPQPVLRAQRRDPPPPIGWRRRLLFLTILGGLAAGVGLAGLRALRPPATPDPLEDPGLATTALLPDAVREATAHPNTPRTRDASWVVERYGVDPLVDGPFAEFQKRSYEIRDGDRVSYLDEGVWVREPLPARKPPGEVWIGTFGASSVESGTFGNWPRRLERALRERGEPVRILNYGMSATGSHHALWRFEHEAIPTGIDVAIFYTGHNDAAHCDYQLDRDALDHLGEYMRTGDERELDAIDPWFSEHRPVLEALRRESNALLDARLRELEAHLGEAPPSELVDEARRVRATHDGTSSLLERVRADPYLYARFQTLFEQERRRAAGRRLAQDPGRLRETLGRDMAEGDVRGHWLYALREAPEAFGARAHTIRQLARAAELARRHSIEMVVVAPPTGYRFHSHDEHACAVFPLSGVGVEAFVAGPLATWQRALAAREGLGFVDLQGALLAEPDPGALFQDATHLTDAGLAVAARTIEPAALQAVERATARSGETGLTRPAPPH